MYFHGPEGLLAYGKGRPGEGGSEEATGCSSLDVPWRAQSGSVEKNKTTPCHSISCEEGSCRFPPWRPGKDGTGCSGCDPRGEDGGSGWRASVPRAQPFCCCQPLARVSELLPRGGRYPCIWNNLDPSLLFCAGQIAKGPEAQDTLRSVTSSWEPLPLPLESPCPSSSPGCQFSFLPLPKETGSCYSTASFLLTVHICVISILHSQK